MKGNVVEPSPRFTDVPHAPPLQKAEELQLGAAIQRGDEAALHRLVEANRGFAVQVALQYQGRGLDVQDLIGEATLGLVEAARRYSPQHRVKFITYAVWWIRSAIQRALARNGSPVPVPVRRFHRGTRPQGMSADGRTLDRLLPSDPAHPLPQEVEVDRELSRVAVGRLLPTLPPRERRVVTLRFGLEGQTPRSLEAIGCQLRVSRERVRQLEARALQRLQARLAGQEEAMP